MWGACLPEMDVSGNPLVEVALLEANVVGCCGGLVGGDVEAGCAVVGGVDNPPVTDVDADVAGARDDVAGGED